MFVHDIPSIAAAHSPSTVAIRDGDRTFTFAELDRARRQLSNALLMLAIPGDRIAYLGRNSAEFGICYYAVPGAGMILTMLNYRHTAKEISATIKHAAPRILIVEYDRLDELRHEDESLTSIETIIVVGSPCADCQEFWQLIESASELDPQVEINENDPCWLIYTSGTTGRPKGVVLSHRNIISSVMNGLASWDWYRRHTTASVFMLNFPMYHVAGYVVLVQHLRRSTILLMTMFDVKTVLTAIGKFGVTETSGAPTMIAMLLSEEQRGQYDMSSLLTISYGASSMPGPLLLAAQRQWPNVRFVTGFGMTELCGNVAILNAEEHDAAAQGDANILGTVGREMLASQIRVADRYGRASAVDAEGEILVKGDQVFSGYWNDPAATAAAFSNGWFRTGDIGRRNSRGYITIAGRKHDLIITGGENVSPSEIEEAILSQSGVMDVGVVGIAHSIWGEEVVAAIVHRDDKEVRHQDIVEALRNQIAGYKIPKRTVVLTIIPRNLTGKIVRSELRDRVRESLEGL